MKLMNLTRDFAINYAHTKMQKSLYNSLNIDILSQHYTKRPNPNLRYMLYIHVPFCHTFCPYCSFHKYAYDEILAVKYFENLRIEMQMIKDTGFDFSSLYVGGGTTLINEKELEKTLILARKLFNIKEISCESDPAHIQIDNIMRFDGLIDRLSVGVQSFDDEILRKVGRYAKFGGHTELIKKLDKINGILPVLSIDLIFNFPFQTRKMLEFDIQTLKSIAPQQWTFYPLMKSPMTRENIAKTLGVSNEDNEFEFYGVICDEFRNFHKSNAWAWADKKYDMNDEYVGSNHEYVGIGSGGFSFLNGELIINAFDLKDYDEFIQKSIQPVIAKCAFSKKDLLRYLFLTELFDGKIDISRFNATNGVSLNKELFVEISLLKLVNAIYEKNGAIYTNEFGAYLCLVLMKEFYAGMDKVRAIFRDTKRVKSSKILRIMQENDEINLAQKTDQKAVNL